MTDSPASGWYPDPQGPPGQQKWWDGAAWTEHTRQAGTATPTVAAAPTTRKTRWWAWLALGLVVLVVIGAASSSDTSTSTDTGPNLATDAFASPATKQPISQPQDPLHFEGNGTRNIGTIRITEDAILRWTNRGGCCGFTLDNLSSRNYDDPSLMIDSSKREGESVIDAGTYHHVEADGGDWTISITAK